MREIKFRGRDEHGEWHYGAFMGVSYDGVVAPIEYANIYDDGMASRVFPDTVGQFTGLTDKDGNAIYEGDIVAWDDGTPPTSVRWDEHFAYYVIMESLILGHACKSIRVVGNVYDNPDLLEVAHD